MSIIANITSLVKLWVSTEIQLAKDDPNSWVVKLLMKLNPDSVVRVIYYVHHLHPGFVHHLITTIVAHIFNFF
jgi:hypothetical protein